MFSLAIYRYPRVLSWMPIGSPCYAGQLSVFPAAGPSRVLMSHLVNTTKNLWVRRGYCCARTALVLHIQPTSHPERIIQHRCALIELAKLRVVLITWDKSMGEP